MKLKMYFLIVIIALNITTVHAQQVNMKENAIKVATLVQGSCENGCSKLTGKPCAVTNKSPDRAITVKVEESFLIHDKLNKKILVLNNIAPSENRYIGCAGCTKDGDVDKCTGYKIVMAYYEQADSIKVRAIFYDDQTKAVTSR